MPSYHLIDLMCSALIFAGFFSYRSLEFIGVAALDPIIIIINSRKFKSRDSLTGEKRRNFELPKNIVFMTHK